MLNALQPICERGIGHIARPYFPNQEGLYAAGRTLLQQNMVKPARTDTFKVLRIHVDPNPDFTSPFTYVDPKTGEWVYVFLKGIHPQNLELLPHMKRARIEWVEPKDFDVASYEQVVAGRLSVTGSWNDLARSLRFDYEMLPYIFAHAISMDTHTVLDSSFDMARFVARRDAIVAEGTPFAYPIEMGMHPRPFTLIAAKDVWHKDKNPQGLWWPVRRQDWTYHYIVQLEAEGKFPHVTWSKHNTRLTHGAGVDQAVWESILLHSYARDIEPIIFFKGLTDPEFFGIYGPQQVVPGDPHAQINLEGLQLYTLVDLIVIDGEAFTHCVLHSAQQMVEHIGQHAPDQIQKLVVVRNGSSSIAGFEDQANAEYAKMQAKGLRLMTYDEVAEEIRRKTA